MKTRAIAAVFLRVLGVWLLIEGLLPVIDMLVIQWGIEHGTPTSGWTSYDPTTRTTESYFHDTYYVITHFRPPLGGYGVRIAMGIAFLAASKPLARLFSRGLEES